MIKKFTLFMVCAICALVANAQTGSGIYLRGEVNGWSDDETVMQDWQFAKIEEGVYILQDKPIYGTFKIGDLSWSEYDYGSNGTVPVMGEEYTLAAKGGDIDLGDAEYQCETITLKIANGNATLLLKGTTQGEVPVDYPFYLAGEMNGWAPNSQDYGFSLEGNGCYSLTFDEAKTFPANTEFKITDGTNIWYGSDNMEGYKLNSNTVYYLNGGDNAKLAEEIVCKKILFIDYSGTHAVYFLTEDNVNSLYIVGPAAVGEWAANNGVKLEYNQETGHYTGTFTTTADNQDFGFARYLTESSGSSDFNVFNALRYGYTENATVEVGVPALFKDFSNVDNNNLALSAPAGTYNIDVDFSNKTFTVTSDEEPAPEYPELFIIGNIREANVFVPNDGEPLTVVSEGVFEIEDIHVYAGKDGYGYFAFTTDLGRSDSDWEYVNSHRYGPEEEHYPIEEDIPAEIGMHGDTSFQIADGTYDMTVDLTKGFITVTRSDGEEAGVEELAGNEASVVAGDGEIRVNGNATVSIYNVCGQRIAADSNATSFSVPAGIYVVVANGKAQKVAVR